MLSFRESMRGLLSTVLLALAASAPAASAAIADPVKVWVTLKDKGPGSTRLLRASRVYEDMAVYAPYVEALGARGLAADVRLKWQNRVSGTIDADAIEGLRGLPFVASVTPMPRKAQARPLPRGPVPWNPGALAKRAAEGLDYGVARPLMESLHVDKVHAFMAASGMAPGRGMRVAVIDADFHLGNPVFTALKSRIKDQYDFVDKKAKAVTDDLLDSHGAECLSLIGGNLPGTLAGAVPEADFLLYRAEEDAQERYVEEDYVAAAIERAVDSGAQVISISLGYRYEYTDGSPDRPYSEFDGRTRPSSIAALGAARRNVLVSVAVGNLPDSLPSTPSLSAPADADSILAVGIADAGRRKCSYSCTGPSADGRVKPDVVSLGLSGGCTVALADPASSQAGTESLAGTSFAAPVIAGVATLLRQLRPNLTAEEIRQALIKTADRYGNPDGLVGHGVVDVAEAARKIGIPINPPLAEIGMARFYHPGGGEPIVLGWDPGKPRPDLQVIDVTGRRVPIEVHASGAVLLVAPKRALRTGVYIARVH